MANNYSQFSEMTCERKYFEHQGIAFEIGPRDPCPGIGWCIRSWKKESQGAFYDGASDHPEGAYQWAEQSARKYIDQVLKSRRRRTRNNKLRR